MKINFTTIARGAQSGFHTSSQMMINSPEKWADVWEQHTSDSIPPPPIPFVDFTNAQVVAVFAGEKPTSGYSVDILAVEKTGDSPSLVITVKDCQPNPGDFASDVITQPYHIIRIPRMDVEQARFEQA
ncbi:protease complex subunit PrcB family protein [Nostoc sp. NMS4]|uniref:protease complex subunit PrcB family protein n=1 Tax=Nostoc sp. NMS4 TaxID=2815390 RepID=UPI0025FD224C|nr:protease complex subunit PrcB family protein [Nostoc sp. NMS4]MBN3927003.1 protease complex subunit PrcB family protein [Nostoc sp. NMS4]